MILRQSVGQPLFFQGFRYARNILSDLKKEKEQIDSFSIIQHQKKNQSVIDQEESNQKEHENEGENKGGNEGGNEGGKEQKINGQSLQKLQKCYHSQKASIKIRKDIIQTQESINKIYQQLKHTNQEIETYEIIFNNLCDCYSANMDKVSKNNRLKRESYRLRNQYDFTLQKIDKVKRELLNLEEEEESVNKYIKESVEQYIYETLKYNQPSDLPDRQTVELHRLFQSASLIEKPQEEQYPEMGLNWEKMKKSKDEKNRKKTLQLNKNTSFDEQMQLNKYYHSEFNDI